MKKLFLYIFLVVISDPYADIDYNRINVYETNYCSDYCYNQNNDDYAYFDEEDDIEEIEDEYRDEREEEDMPLIFDLDSWLNRK